MSIIVGLGGPFTPAPSFYVLAADQPDEPVCGPSMTTVWEGVIERVRRATPGAFAPSTSVSGPLYFGLMDAGGTELCSARSWVHEGGGVGRLENHEVHGVGCMREGVWGGWRMMKCMGWQGGWGRSGRVGSPLPSATANASPARRRRAPRLPTHPFGTLKRLEIPTVPAPAGICRLLEAADPGRINPDYWQELAQHPEDDPAPDALPAGPPAAGPLPAGPPAADEFLADGED